MDFTSSTIKFSASAWESSHAARLTSGRIKAFEEGAEGLWLLVLFLPDFFSLNAFNPEPSQARHAPLFPQCAENVSTACTSHNLQCLPLAVSNVSSWIDSHSNFISWALAH